MSKPELGTKRACSGCNAKFYDLHKMPIVCPTCETVFVPPKPVVSRSRRPLVPEPEPVLVKPVVAETEGEPADTEKESDDGTVLLEELDEE